MQKKSKKLITMAATATLVATATVPAVSAASFWDTAGNTHATSIEALVSRGIISGYPDGTFKPNKTLSRSDVVKLLGKYLVSQGYSIPSDYKRNMRFNDLRPTSQDELLQYAALVKDNGVFNGSNGNLLPNDPITRENMAVVLVRAFSNINNFDFLNYVSQQYFQPNVQDYYAAKAEARAAIKVLDYYNITGVASFNPKGYTTRGQFSSFLYKTLQVDVPGAALKTVEVIDATTLKVKLEDNTTHTVKLDKALENGKETTVQFKINGKTYSAKVTYEANLTVKFAEVISANKLKITLSNNKVYDITLDKNLPENEETTVTFKINGKEYTTKVKHVVSAVKVSSVKAVNGAQIEIKFNQKVNLPEQLTQARLANYVSVKGIDTNGTVVLKYGYLSADGRTLTVITDGTTPLSGRYLVKVKDVKNSAGTTVTAYDEIVNFGKDTTAPTLESTTNIDAKTVRVTFSEPLRAYNNGSITFKLANGTNVAGITGEIATGAWTADFNLMNARANGQPLPANTIVYATFAGLRDVAGNFSSPNPLSTSFIVGGGDGVKPTLAAVAQTGPKTFKLTFSEHIQKPAVADLEVKLGTTINPITAVESVARDNRSFIITTAHNLDGVYNIGTAGGKYIMDISGETNTFSVKYAFEIDADAPQVTSYAISRIGNDEYLYIALNTGVSLVKKSRVTATGNYVKDGVTYNFTGIPTAVAYKSNNNNIVLRVKLADLLAGGDVANATYNITLAFTDVKSTDGINAANKAISFTRAEDYVVNRNVLKAPIVSTSVNDPSLTNSQVKLVFNHDVDEATGTNKDNYTIANTTIQSAQVLSNESNTVLLTLHPGSTKESAKSQLLIKGVKAKDSVANQPPLLTTVKLKENVSPTVISAEFLSYNQIEVTFSESITGLSNDSFVVVLDNDNLAIATIESRPRANNKAIITLMDTFTANTVVTVKKGSNVATVVDKAGNKLVDTFELPVSFIGTWPIPIIK